MNRAAGISAAAFLISRASGNSLVFDKSDYEEYVSDFNCAKVATAR